MAPSRGSRRLLAATGLAIAVAAPTLAALTDAPASAPTRVAACPIGEDPDQFTTTCVPSLVPNSPALPAAGDLCPPGVTGAECTVESPARVQPQITGPTEGSPEQQLIDVSTPDF